MSHYGIVLFMYKYILGHIFEDLKIDSLEGSPSLLEKISCVMYQV